MVSTHSWKATVSSPPPTNSNTTRQSSSYGRSPGGYGGMSSSPAHSGGMSGTGYGAPASGGNAPFIGGSSQKPTTASGTAMNATSGATPDFESLLANSASLLSSMGRIPGASSAGFGANPASAAGPSSTGNSNVALGDKSLLELSVASRASSSYAGADGANNARHAASYESEASAHRLLAREGYGFDSARLGRSARELERRAHVPSDYRAMEEEEKKDGEIMNAMAAITNGGVGGGGGAGRENHPLASLRGGSVQQILSGHHEHCVKTALREAREWTTSQSQRRVEERLKSDWEATRREILGRGVVGNRFLLGAAASVGGGAGMGVIGNGDLGGGVASRVPLLEGDSATIGGSSPWSNIVPSPQTLPADAEGLITSHLASIDAHLTSTETNSTNAALELLASLQDGIKAAASNPNGSSESMESYSSALSLVASVVNCSTSLGVDTSNNDNDSAAAAGIMGACNFFARQYASHAREMVRDAQLAGMMPSTSTLGGLTSAAREVCAFASIVAGRDVVEGRGGVWPRLFYCLRCGDLAAADSVLARFGNAGAGSNEDTALVDPAIANLVSQLSNLQQTQETIFGDTTNGNSRPAQPLQSSLLNPTQSMMQSRRIVGDLYERTKTRAQSSSDPPQPHEHYRTACLAMLGGAESISEAAVLESSGIVKTVEDYLFGSLWHALHLADASKALGGGGGLRGVAGAVARLSVLVNQWGPSYFEPDANAENGSASAAVAHAVRGPGGDSISPSGGWAYALPLLATQQYATALAYLAEAGGGAGLMQATHVALVMDGAGLAAEDFKLNRSEDGSSTLLPMLVASYSASLQGMDAVAAFKYLVLLSDESGKFVKEQVQRLLLETRRFESLAGAVQPDGARSNGALDAHFSRKEVDSILAEAAGHAVRTGRPADAAELLVLSGRFGALFELMNRELASYLSAAVGTEDFQKRQFWFNAASQFHAIHLTHGRSYVQNTLQNEGKMSLGNTFQLLLNLIVFFDRCREQQWDGAWALMDSLRLLPGKESEMTQRVEAFRSLDGCVRQSFHHVVLATMEALCHLYRSTKQQGGGGMSNGNNVLGNNDTVNQSLGELRTRARLLVTFARLLNLPKLGDGDTYVRINQLEKNMM